jgi:hypothetical protein
MMGFESDDDDPEPQQVLVTDIPDSIVEVARFWGDFNPGGNLSSENPQPLTVEYASDAQQMVLELEQRAREERRGRTDAVLALWTRTTEKACKLALLYACSANHERPFVDAEAAAWATELSEYLTRKMIAAASDWVSENVYESKLKRLYRDIRAAGEEGLTRSDIYRKTRHLNKKEREELLERLVELGDVRDIREETGGAPRFRYTAY